MPTALRRITTRRRPRAPYKNLIDLIRKRLDETPRDVRLRYSLATHLSEAGRYGEAIVEAERLLEIDPAHSGIKRLLLGLKLHRFLHRGDSNR